MLSKIRLRLRLNKNSSFTIFVLGVFVYLFTSFVVEDNNIKILRPILDSEVWENVSNWTGVICAFCYAVVAYLVPMHNTNKVKCNIEQLKNVTFLSTAIFVISIMIYLTSMLVPPLLQAIILLSVIFLLDKLTLCVTYSIENPSQGNVSSLNYQESTRYSRRSSRVNKSRRN